jgi:uncharacterized protein
VRSTDEEIASRQYPSARRASFLDRVIGRLSASAALRRAIRLNKQSQTTRAFALFARAAGAGIAEAEYRVGRCYLEGSSVPVSLTESVRWLTRAAAQDHVEAQWLLAALHVHGVGAEADPRALAGETASTNLFSAKQALDPDFVAAEKWARRAAERGSADGQAVLAYILTSGPESMRNLEEAHAWYQRAAEAGCPQGALGYAQSLARSVKDEEGRRRVVENLRCAAQAGLAPATHLLGVMTEHGCGTERDPAAAAEFYRQAAAKDNRSGQANWGRVLTVGLGVEPNPAEGESWLRRAGLAGDPDAAALVGDLYAKGGSLPPNYAEAAIWFRRAAEAGHKTAARALGLLYLTGAGVARDPKEAANWLRIAVDAGDSQARVDLANLLLRGFGDGRVEDLINARHWLEQAASAGNLVAAFNYGLCLAEGAGVERDERQAVRYLRRAADGVANAQYWYGRMLVDGRGTEANAEAGRTWIARAAAVGVADAEAALAEMMVNGRGGPRDRLAAAALFEKAAGKGHVGAMYALGLLSDGGHDMPPDPAVAQHWFRAAAERGHAEAQKMLGRYLARGLAGERDLEAARLWLGRAVAQGLADAKLDLASIRSVPPTQPSEQMRRPTHLAKL